MLSVSSVAFILRFRFCYPTICFVYIHVSLCLGIKDLSILHRHYLLWHRTLTYTPGSQLISYDHMRNISANEISYVTSSIIGWDLAYMTVLKNCSGMEGRVDSELNRAYRLAAIVATAILAPSQSCQVTATRWKTRFPWMKYTTVESSIELTWVDLKIMHRDYSPSADRQGTCPHCREMNGQFGTIQLPIPWHLLCLPCRARSKWFSHESPQIFAKTSLMATLSLCHVSYALRFRDVYIYIYIYIYI